MFRLPRVEPSCSTAAGRPALTSIQAGLSGQLWEPCGIARLGVWVTSPLDHVIVSMLLCLPTKAVLG